MCFYYVLRFLKEKQSLWYRINGQKGERLKRSSNAFPRFDIRTKCTHLRN